MELGPGVGIALPYQIMALVEVFADSSKQAIRDGLAGLSSQFIAGPDASPSKASSGVYQIVRGLTVLRTERLPYQNRGDPWRDADYWSNKGIAVSFIQLGAGVVELYGTHLYNGGDLVKDPSQDEKLDNKRAQVGELISFFKANHDPRNVAMIVGDFNLAADNTEGRKDERAVMEWLMAQTKTRDLWEWQWETRRLPRSRSIPRRRVGHTGDGGSDPTAFCTIDAANMFCSDDSQISQAGERIDWVLVEDPRPEHTFTLDLSRLRRRPFPRGGAGFLSDHVGLDTTLIANAIAHT
jgi:exonuclease III